MGGAVFADKRYRTGLGVAFYDRVGEVERLSRLVNAYRVVVVYGPRNAGKSELVRYWAHTMQAPVFIVDCRALRARHVLGDAVQAIVGPRSAGEQLVRLLAQEISRVLTGSPGIVDVALAIMRLLGSRFERYVILVDEFHELPRYSPGGYGEAVMDLASLAALLLKSGEGRARLVVVASEGFAATHNSRARLQGYSTAFMLVDHMDPIHFRALYEEYRGRHGCNVPFEIVYGLFGGLPGQLAELCPLTVDDIVGDIIPALQENLEHALETVRARLGVEARKAIELAWTILTSTIQPLRNPQAYEAGETLVEHNIAYPQHARGGIRYRPHYPAYMLALRLAVEKRVESIYQLNPQEILQTALRENAPSTRG